jgi:hypothetical protein
MALSAAVIDKLDKLEAFLTGGNFIDGFFNLVTTDMSLEQVNNITQFLSVFGGILGGTPAKDFAAITTNTLATTKNLQKPQAYAKITF